ncbi:MAG TPA: response regulator [Phycisphaerae bacterium]|nr:response regulator [Phycisphaerae bacterium]
MPESAHVLLLDDDEGILRLARKALERAGYRVSAASSADAAWSLVANTGAAAPDLLVLDYQLNNSQTGLDFFRNARANHPSANAIPAILVTGFSDESKIIEALRAGISDVIPKAGEYLDYLPEAVERALAQARDRRQAAQAELLREREEHYRTLAEALPQLVWTCLPNGDCDFLSKQWLDYTGMPQDQQLQLKWIDTVIHPDDRQRTAKAWSDAVAGRAPYDLEYRIRRHDGAYRWFKVRGVPVKDLEGRILKWFGTCTDVHDTRELLEERERLLAAEQHARLEAERANHAKDRFLAMLSHELRTPLTPVLAAAQMLEAAADLPDSLRPDAAIIRRNIELEARLIDDLLDLTRVSKGKLQLSLETVDAHAAIRAVLDLFRADIQEKHLQLELHLDAPHHHLRADYARLQQMLWNLIKNAAKFTPDRGRIAIHTSNRPALNSAADTPDSQRLLIEIRDSGIGFSPEQALRLFTAFEQGGHNVTRRFGGLGLGLAITKALVELHGGSVSAHSLGEGLGATFSLELPVISSPARNDRPDQPSPANPARRSLRILLVEDHPDTARVMGRLIATLGHQVETVGSVTDALERLAHAPFDLLASDVGLPDGTGLDLIREIRKRSNIPAIALSGFGMEEDVRQCLDAGFNGHLTKPVNIDRLNLLMHDLTPP